MGAYAPQVTLTHAWDDGLPPSGQASGVAEDFNAAGQYLRSIADNPYTARLDGNVFLPSESRYAIVRIFCFQAAQSDGKHWISIVSAAGQMNILEDGTGHGDPGN